MEQPHQEQKYVSIQRDINLFEDKMPNSLNENVEVLRDSIYTNNEGGVESWKSFESQMASLGFIEKNVESYLSSAARIHGSHIFVRRADLTPVFSALESKSSFTVKQLDNEPNAALLGSVHKEKNGDEVISGLEAALTGGFGWVIENKVAGVYGFTTEHSDVSISNLEENSLSRTKKYAEVMRGIRGEVSASDILFFFLRIHKSAYPDDLCHEEDFDEITGERKPFVLRLYAKNHQTH